ncbi:MAG: cytochrome c oxidase subunit II [Caldilineales bacterium]|nr:cytochrome c oxidase subunit II [Caldilineales bacterium]MDW8317302.1 cytochrome c oxidase subunit II [Anaerolineae bacterium]
MARERVLIVSAHPLFREGIARLLEGQAEVVGVVSTWEEAKAIVPARSPQVIVVDHADATLKEADLAPLLWPDIEDLRVIYVTLAGDKMTVHERHQVIGAGEADLLAALKGQRSPTARAQPIPYEGRSQRMEKSPQRRSYTRHFAIVSALVAVVGVLSAYGLIQVPKFTRASAQGETVDWVMDLHFALIGFLFALVVVFMLYAVIVFRRKPGEDGDGDHFEGNTKLEITWTVLPLITVLAFGVIGTRTLADVTKPQPNEMVVEVAAFSFGWQFSYPEYGISNVVNRMVVPVNQPLLLKLRSWDNDVIHNFYVPEFRVKQDLVPGLPTELRVTPNRVGTYKLRCNELCGTGHTLMLADVVVVERAEFDAWVKEQGAQLTPEEMARRGQEVYTGSGCAACHNLTGEPGLPGPSWKGLYGAQIALADGSTVTADEEYIRRSILYPNEQIHAGYNPGIMPQNYGDILSEQQIAYLIEFIKTLNGQHTGH